MGKFAIGVDTGGTFTDVVRFDKEQGVFTDFKSPTTPHDHSVGIMNGFRKTEVNGKDLESFTQGSTIGLNAIITRSGTKVGLLYTEGFRDLMDIGRAWRPVSATVDPQWRRPHEERPIVPRFLRRPVKERILADGNILIPLEKNLDALRQELEYFAAHGVESIAVCLLHAYKHPQHELLVKQIIEKEFPQFSVDISSEICPYPKEYGRTSTTLLNSYIRPILEKYMKKLESEMAEVGYTKQIWTATNQGGTTSFKSAMKKPVLTLGSGPVGGVIGAKYLSNLLDIDNVITFDMGGTSTDVSIITNKNMLHTREMEFEFDIITSLPVIEVKSVGAGGGSIAWIDPAGAVNVGPQSAVGVPGPACYAKGGTHPTVTDAYAIRGILSPDYALGGEINIKSELAHKVVHELAEPLKLSSTKMANLISRIASNNMSEAIKNITINRGLDPRNFTLMAFGAGGPIPATDIARELGIPRVLVPSLAGSFSAFGLTQSDLTFESTEPIMKMENELNEDELHEVFLNLSKQCINQMKDHGIDTSKISLSYSFDSMYAGQSWELIVKLSDLKKGNLIDNLIESFHQTHEILRGYRNDDMPIRVLTARVTAFGTTQDLSLIEEPLSSPNPSPESLIGTRQVLFEEKGEIDTACYKMELLKPGNIIQGPAVIHHKNYTVLLQPNDHCQIDQYKNCLISIN